MAALGFAVSGAGGGSGPNPASAAEMQARQGTGTVLGDAAAKSNSIANSIDRLSDIDQLTMRYSAQMAASLRNIESSMGGLASIVVRTYGLTTGNITGVQTGISTETFGQSMGALGFMDRITEQALSQLPVIGDLAKGLFSAFGSTKVKLIDSGVQFDQGSIADYIAGLGMSQYGTLETTKKSWFGLSRSSSTSVVNQALDDEIKRQFGLLFASLDTSLVAAANALGVSTGQISEQIQAFQLDMQRLSLKGMNGAEVQEALGNYFSAVFDKVSGSVLPGLEDWQKVGEGYYETLIRVASGADQARYYTDQLGITMAGLGDVANTQGDAAAELLRASITMAEGQSAISRIITGYTGSVDELSSVYSELLDVQRMLRAVGSASSDLSGGLIRTAGGLDALKDGLGKYFDAYFSESEKSARSIADITQQFSVLGVALPDSKAAFRALVESIDITTESGQRLYVQLLELSDPFAAVADAASEAKSAIAGQRADLQAQIDTLTGNTAAIRARELAAIDPANRALQERIYALQEEKDATAAAASAAAAAANQRDTLERQIMNLVGDTQGIRSRELAALDSSNRALQERVWAIQDETNAQKEAAAAAEKIKSTYEQLTSGFEGSIRNVQMSVLDNEGKYNYLDNEAARYRDMLMSVSDPQMLESYASKLRATIDQSYSLLTEEQQKASAAEFIARYQAASDLVTSRLNESRNQAEKDRQSMADAFKAAAIAAAEQSAQIIRSAGEAIPPKIDIGVSVSASAGLSAVTEVGY